MTVVHDDNGVTVHHAACLDVLRELDDASVHAVVTDPPYGLGDHRPDAIVTALTAWANGDRERVPDGRGFMGRAWDAFVPPPAVWDECLRVLKPGGHLVCFAGARTIDLMGLSIRMAGFEVRDTIGLAGWVQSQGFAKSRNVSKAIDQEAGVEREVVGSKLGRPGYSLAPSNGDHRTYSQGLGNTSDPEAECAITAPATDEARRWDGWHTALSPAIEPIIVARKPLDGTVAQTVTRHGTGALNIAACRVGSEQRVNPPAANKAGGASLNMSVVGMPEDAAATEATGRWPKNFLLTHAPLVDDTGEVIGDACADGCVPGCHVAELDAQTGILTTNAGTYRRVKGDAEQARSAYAIDPAAGHVTSRGDSGGGSRFFPVFRYEAKAPSSERPLVNGVGHVTVKPLSLMAWLVRLVTPPGGTVVDPFAGSGTTGLAAAMQGFRAVLVEREPSEPGAPDHIAMIRARLARRPREARPDTPPRKPAPEGQSDLFAALDDESA